jgi:hypothetical protein
MRRFGRDTRLALAGAALLVSAFFGVLAFAGPASAAATLTVTPNTGLSAGTSVTIGGSGFADSSPGAYLECNSDAAQPTIAVAGNAVPVSCSNPLLHIITTSATGGIPAGTTFSVIGGTVGPPATGADSGGGDAATDAAKYPCPPTAAQQTAGDTCQIAFGTLGGAQVFTPITFTGQGTGTTTTTTTGGGGTTTTTPTGATTTTTGATTTTTSAGATTTTSTTVPCNAQPTTVAGPPNMTLTPGTCLNGGTVVKVTGSGFDPGASGTILQCNSDKAQPTVALPAPVSQDVPVSCTGINVANLITVGTDGTISGSATIIFGVTGPPCGKPAYALTPTCPTSDSGGAAPATDAANYPCPPTAAQIAAGDVCTLSFGDSAGKTQTVAISYTPAASATGGGSGTTTTTTAAAAAATAAQTAAATKAATSASTLAFTGAGPDTWYTLLGGLLLLDLGFLILTLYYRPREMVEILSRGVHKTFGGK